MLFCSESLHIVVPFFLQVKIGNKNEVCLKNDPSEDDIDCLVTNDGVASTKVIYNIIKRPVPPHSSLVNIKTQAQGYILFEFYTGSTFNVSPDPIPVTH